MVCDRYNHCNARMRTYVCKCPCTHNTAKHIYTIHVKCTHTHTHTHTTHHTGMEDDSHLVSPHSPSGHRLSHSVSYWTGLSSCNCPVDGVHGSPESSLLFHYQCRTGLVSQGIRGALYKVLFFPGFEVATHNEDIFLCSWNSQEGCYSMEERWHYRYMCTKPLAVLTSWDVLCPGPAVWYAGQMEPQVGSIFNYLYFLFAPILLYRDRYPR